MNQDAEHLRLLSIFHYVVAGVAALCSFFPLLYTAMGFVFITLSHRPPTNPAQQPPPPALGWAFVVLGIFLLLLGAIFAIVVAFAGRSLSRRNHYWFAFVVACVECIFVPVGTILGVFTIIVLSRESVKTLFPPVTPQASG
jgi:predicted membrane channel-forming protein YqfA (hemolysin III family)